MVYAVLRRILEHLVCLVLWFFVSPLLLVQTCLLVFRLTIHLLAWMFRPDLIPVNSPVDNILIVQPSSSHPIMNISGSHILEGKLDVVQFREHFKQTFFSSEDLRQRYVNLTCYYVTWGLYIFKKISNNINLDERIREISLQVKDHSELEEFIGKYVELSDYGTNPHWEILLIHVNLSQMYTSQTETEETFNKERKRTILVFKIDHGLCDGYSMTHLLDKLSGIQSTYPVKNKEYTLGEKISLTWKSPINMCRLFKTLVSSGEVRWSQLNNAKKNEMFMSWIALDLDKFRKARRLAGVHFGTLMGVVLAESLRRFILSRRPEMILQKNIITLFPWGQPNHPTMFGGPMTNHLSGTSFRVGMQETDIVSKIREAERHYIKMNHDWKLPDILFFVLMPFAWPIPRFVLKFVQDAMPDGIIKSKFGHVFSPNIRPSAGYSFLGVPVERGFPHARFTTGVDFLRLQMFSSSNGRNLSVTVGGRSDTFSGKKEIDYIAKELVPQVVDDILLGLEKSEADCVKVQCDR